MKRIRLAIIGLVVLAFASCGSDEPQWADPEAHEKTEQLREQYTPFIVGTWHYEKRLSKTLSGRGKKTIQSIRTNLQESIIKVESPMPSWGWNYQDKSQILHY